MAVPFRALHDHVLIKPLPQKETKGGLALPDNLDHSEDLLQGIVVTAGPGVHTATGKFVETAIKPGDRVWLSFRGMPQDVTIEGAKYILCREAEIVGMVASQPDPILN